MFTVRAARPSDHLAIVSLYTETFRGLGVPSWATLRVAHSVVAMEGDALVGFGFAQRLGRGSGLDVPGVGAEVGDTLMMASAVALSHRRRGIGHALIAARVSEARAFGSSCVYVHCVAGSGSAELYAAAGFERVVTVERYYRDDRGMTLMRLTLSEGPGA